MNENEKNKPNKFTVKGKVKVVNGTILTPEYAGLRLVLNFVSDSNVQEGELYPIFNKKWKQVREEAKGWYASRINFKLGETATIAVQSDTWVINCLCKDSKGVVSKPALESCLKKVKAMAKMEKASLHVSTLLLKDSADLKNLLMSEMVDDGIHVSFYEEPSGKIEKKAD